MLVASYHILLGQAPTSHSFTLSQKTSLGRNSLLQQLLLHWCPSSLLGPKGGILPQILYRACLWANHMQYNIRRAPSSKRQEVTTWNKALKLTHAEAFSWDSDLVKEARKEYFSKHSYNFTMEGTCNLSEVFRQMAESAELLDISIYEIQALWTGPDELRQANYALRSLPKGLKFLCVVPPSESPKVMGPVGIHDLDALCHFNGLTHCLWYGKEGQNEGAVVNHLWTVHYRVGLVCNKCNDCPSTTSDTLCCHGQQNCQQPGEKNPDESVSSE